MKYSRPKKSYQVTSQHFSKSMGEATGNLSHVIVRAKTEKQARHKVDRHSHRIVRSVHLVHPLEA